MLKTEIIEDLKGLGGFALYVIIILSAIIFNEYLLAYRLLVGLILTFVVIILFRAFYFKARPVPENFKGFIGKIDASSFPSMHSMRAAVMYTIIAAHFMNFWLALIGIVAIMSVGFARIIRKRHFFTDVLAGIILGLLVAWISFALII